jgi:hypothetical protein
MTAGLQFVSMCVCDELNLQTSKVPQKLGGGHVSCLAVIRVKELPLPSMHNRQIKGNLEKKTSFADLVPQALSLHCRHAEEETNIQESKGSKCLFVLTLSTGPIGSRLCLPASSRTEQHPRRIFGGDRM